MYLWWGHGGDAGHDAPYQFKTDSKRVIDVRPTGGVSRYDNINHESLKQTNGTMSTSLRIGTGFSRNRNQQLHELLWKHRPGGGFERPPPRDGQQPVNPDWKFVHSGRLQPIHRQLGSAGVDDGGGHRDHPRAG